MSKKPVRPRLKPPRRGSWREDRGERHPKAFAVLRTLWQMALGKIRTGATRLTLRMHPPPPKFQMGNFWHLGPM